MTKRLRWGRAFTLLLVCITATSYGATRDAAAAGAMPVVTVLVDQSSVPKGKAQLDIQAIEMLSLLFESQATVEMYEVTNKLVARPAFAGTAASPNHESADAHGAASLFELLNPLLTNWETQAPSPRFLVIVSQGFHALKPETNNQLVDQVSQRLNELNITTFGINLGDSDALAQVERVTAYTHGWFWGASQRAEAERAFARIIDRVTEQNHLPLTDSLVRIDKSVSEVNLLVFRDDPNLPSEFMTPSLDSFSQFNAPQYTEWLASDNFEIIRIRKPEAGTWQVKTTNDHDNRAFAATGLRIYSEPLPLNVLPQRRVALRFHVRKDDKPIQDKTTLGYMVVKVTQLRDGTPVRTWFPLDEGEAPDEIAGDGRFTLMLDDSLEVGMHEFVIEAESIDFQRQKRFSIAVNEFGIIFHESSSSETAEHDFSFYPRTALMVPDTMIINANLVRRGSESNEVAVPRISNFTWRLSLPESSIEDYERIEFNVAGASPDGRASSTWLNVSPQIAPIQIRDTVQRNTTPDNDDHTTNAAEPPHTTTTTEPVRANDDFSAPSHWVVGLQLAGIHLVLGIAAYFALLLHRRREVEWSKQLQGMLTHG